MQQSSQRRSRGVEGWGGRVEQEGNRAELVWEEEGEDSGLEEENGIKGNQMEK